MFCSNKKPEHTRASISLITDIFLLLTHSHSSPISKCKHIPDSAPSHYHLLPPGSLSHLQPKSPPPSPWPLADTLAPLLSLKHLKHLLILELILRNALPLDVCSLAAFKSRPSGHPIRETFADHPAQNSPPSPTIPSSFSPYLALFFSMSLFITCHCIMSLLLFCHCFCLQRLLSAWFTAVSPVPGIYQVLTV